MQDKMQQIWKCGYPEIIFLRGFVCWYIQIPTTNSERETFEGDDIGELLDKALRWAKQNKRSSHVSGDPT